MRLGFMIDEIVSDVRWSVRGLLKRPVFTAVAASSLALGIGATTAILTLVDPLLFRPLAVDRPAELVVIGGTAKALGTVPAPIAPLPVVRELRERKDLFQEVAAMRMWVGNLRAAVDQPGEKTMGFLVTGRYFSLFAVRPALGRLISDQDDVERAPVAVLSYERWESDYHGDPNVVGQRAYLSGVPLTIIGVAPKGLVTAEPLFRPGVYVPSTIEGLISGFQPADRWDAGGYEVIARRQLQVPHRSVVAALEVYSRQIAHDHPEIGDGFKLAVFTAQAARPTISAGSASSLTGALFLAMAALVLLTGAINTTNLVLTRASVRKGELTVRQALGASRARVARQLLTENVVLGLVGLAGGWGLAALAASWLRKVPQPMDVPVAMDFRIDARVLTISAAVALVAAIIAGIWPAVVGTRWNLARALRENGGRGTIGRGGHRVRATLVAGQVAAALVVLVFAAMFGASVREAGKIDVGLRLERVLTLSLDLTPARLDSAGNARLLGRMADEIRALPSVETVAWSSDIPLSHSSGSIIDIFGDDPTAVGSKSGSLGVLMSTVTSDYFAALGVPIVAGRGFTKDEVDGGRSVVVVNERAAELLWPNQTAVGRQIRLSRDGPPISVVGVSHTGRYVLIGESPRPAIYLPLQGSIPFAFLEVRVKSGDPLAIMGSVRSIITGASPELVPWEVQSLESMVRNGYNGLLPYRLGAAISSTIGVLALILTIVGLYGVIAYSVAQRTQEIGVRVAMGASPWRIVSSVLGQGVRLAGAGIAIGLAAALLVTKAVSGLLVNVAAHDAMVLGSVVGLLLAVTLASAFLPARRAARLDPIKALRDG